ncbi:DUF2846 domain-containing protein [Herbaspirillum sp. alder98]|uniref:DUF2846 domain-containing protein n=1 Tax=Herbaspirillum sp. alder98 TaxID=2913096 RepID=UPI001CD8B2B6|nr:DUF2846 domain-containing protein [Herbaspirillum sp. alder98]MCA1322746.1 DUF2846 domain-containing protein [Herbaspirillum sp. alder98]
MKTIRPWLALVMLVAVLAGCASGPKHADIDYAIPAIKPGFGRIYFLRSSAFIGSPVQPEIKLNNQVVGRSRPRGFFFVDRPAGPYMASSATSVSSALTFDLYPGEVKYVRTEVTIALFGIMPGSIAFSLMDQSIAEPELSKLSYTGTSIKAQPKQAPMPAAAPAPAPTPAMPPAVTPAGAPVTAPVTAPVAVPAAPPAEALPAQ